MAKDNNNSIQNKKKPSIIIIAFALIMGFAFWYLTESVNGKIIDANIETMKELSVHDLNSIKNSILLRWDNMEGVAKEISGTEFENTEELISVLKTRTADIPSATRMSLLDSEGTNFMSNGVVQKNSYLADICAGKSERFVVRLNTDTHFSENVHEVLFEAVPVDFEVDGKQFEWMICQFPINTLEKELKITSYNGEGYSSVIDVDGNYIINISRNHSFTSYDNFFDDLNEAKVEGSVSISELCSTTTTGANSVIYTQNGRKNIMVVSAFDITDWYFISTVPVSVFDAQTRSITSSFFILLAILAAFVASVLVLLLLQRKQQTELQISEAANRSKTEFLFNMSHDIRTPMNAILGYTDIALRHSDDKNRVNESLGKIRVAGSHLLNLINDILEMSRIESGKMEFADEPTDLRKIMTAVEQMSGSFAVSKSIDFQSVIGDMNNPYVYADELHLNEILINLTSNAIKYTPEGGKVRIRVDQIGYVIDGKTTFRFEIADNGIGMSEEFQQHLFETFSREKTSTVSKLEGTGLGLSIVKKIVDQAQGKISVKSKPGEGSTFTVELPLRIMDAEAIAKYEEENKPLNISEGNFSFENRKVLLVEDNEMNREIATEILEEVGLVIDTAEDGEIAVDTVKQKGLDYYDFILMDIQMPVMDGFEATKAIRALPGGDQVTIIALSANAFEEDVQRSLESGMNAHVAKPIDVKELFETMQGLLS
ncbi:MAG: ATP-binding protein [Eubacteriales bacterium]|nr:ATP-binding protein [Eubacteriales bacterium]